jgi:hypothetical protein
MVIDFNKIFGPVGPQESDVLIVARTQMSPGNVCIGGFDIGTKSNIRLLTSTGGNQPDSAVFQIGQIWKIVYTPKTNLTPPHLEDVMVQSSRISSTLSGADLVSFITKNCSIISGSLDGLFGGAVKSPLRHASYIDASSVPNHSVCFWMPNSDLVHVNSFAKDKYHYVDVAHDTYFAYVGLVPPVAVIPYGSIVRISLPRWWAAPGATSKVCYLQLSGWY